MGGRGGGRGVGLAAVALAGAAWLAPAEARAQAAEPETRWYGWQTLVVEGAALGTFAVGFGAEATYLMPPAMLAMLFGAPVVHLAHGRPLVSLASLGLQLGASMGGGFLSAIALCGGRDDGPGGSCGSVGFGLAFLIGAGVGHAAALALDVAFLSHETLAPEAGAGAQALTPLAWGPRIGPLAPALALTPRGGVAGFAGAF